MRKILVALTLLLCVLTGPVARAQTGQQAAIVVTTLCSAITTGTCGTIHGPLNGKNVTIYLETSAGVSAGTVVIEEASSDAFAGTWSSIQSFGTTTANASTGIHIPGLFGAARVRISSNIVGGTLTVTSLVGQ